MDIDKLAERVQKIWIDKLRESNYHPPIECPNRPEYAKTTENMFLLGCTNCARDMYPYLELPGTVKAELKTSVEIVLKAIEELKDADQQEAEGTG